MYLVRCDHNITSSPNCIKMFDCSGGKAETSPDFITLTKVQLKPLAACGSRARSWRMSWWSISSSPAVKPPLVVLKGDFFQLQPFETPFSLQVFLKSDRVARMVQSGGCSANDSREVFKKHIEKRVRSLPEIDGLSKETVLSSWMAKFDAIYRGEEDPRKQQARMTASAASELILSKEQLYEMFQNILGIKKFEHQLLYNACQVRWEWKRVFWGRLPS